MGFRLRLTALLIGSALGFTACAPPAATPAATSAAPAAIKAAPTPYKAPSGTPLRTVRLAQSILALSFAPLIVAREMGYFEQQGIKLEFTQLQSGASALQALVGGSIDFVDSASTEVAAAVANGIPLIAVQNTINMTLEICVRTDFLTKKNVTVASPLKDRIAALKGATIAISGAGAVSDRAMRWLLTKYGGLDPNKDTEIVVVGGADLMAGALEANRVQAFLLSPPNCEVTGLKGGVVLVKPSEIPEFKNYVHEVLYSTKAWVAKNKDAATRTATALSMGNNFMLKYPDASIAILQKEYSKIDRAIIERATREIILPQVIKDGKMTEAQWKDTNTVLVEAGLITKPLDVTSGAMWTNDYIGDANIP